VLLYWAWLFPPPVWNQENMFPSGSMRPDQPTRAASNLPPSVSVRMAPNSSVWMLAVIPALASWSLISCPSWMLSGVLDTLSVKLKPVAVDLALAGSALS
jgi:hypothetical protein